MLVSKAENLLKKVENMFDFQELFFTKIDGEYIAEYESIVYEVSDGNYTDNPSAKKFDLNGNCTNSYLKFEDGYLPNPF
jgi:hypothetical protein